MDKIKPPEDQADDYIDKDGYAWVTRSELDQDALHHLKKQQKFGLLQQLDHRKIDYKPFRKDFYAEDDMIKSLPESQVNRLR